jgi:hypothetical protein
MKPFWYAHEIETGTCQYLDDNNTVKKGWIWRCACNWEDIKGPFKSELEAERDINVHMKVRHTMALARRSERARLV